MARKTIKTNIEINTTAQGVWSILTDFEKYSEWNPFIKSIKGEMVVDQSIAIELGGMSFKPKLLVFNKNRELRWKGKLLIKGLFDGEHSFTLIPNREGGITFLHEEEFNGLLVGFFSKKLDNETKQGFELMNLALKKRAELANN